MSHFVSCKRMHYYYTVVLSDAGIVSLTKNQNSLQRCVIEKQPLLTAKGFSALKSPLLETVDLSLSGVDTNGLVICYFC